MPKSQRRMTDAAPALAVVTADAVITSVSSQPLTVQLRDAGRYLVDLVMYIECDTLAQARNLTIGLTVGAAFLSMRVRRAVFRSLSTIAQLQQLQTAPTSLTLISMGFSPMRAHYKATGLVVVVGPAQVAASMSMAAETATVRAGSFLRAQLLL